MLKDRENKGITLVALVITIVILLILAGISISVLTNTGIFQKAKDAKGKIPSDYDNGKIFTNEYHHIWDACSQNDIDLLDKLVSESLVSTAGIPN